MNPTPWGAVGGFLRVGGLGMLPPLPGLKSFRPIFLAFWVWFGWEVGRVDPLQLFVCGWVWVWPWEKCPPLGGHGVHLRPRGSVSDGGAEPPSEAEAEVEVAVPLPPEDGLMVTAKVEEDRTMTAGWATPHMGGGRVCYRPCLLQAGLSMQHCFFGSLSRFVREFL